MVKHTQTIGRLSIFTKYVNEDFQFHILSLYAPVPQNGQTQSSNSPAVADELSVSDHFAGLTLKGLAL